VFKKAAQIAVTFGLLVAAYAGYSRGFAIVAALLMASREADESVPFPEVESKSAQMANELARESFGESSWPASKSIRMVYYDAGRGAWIYAQNYKRLDDGRRIQVWPFAMISASKDGKSRKTATSDEAIIDLSQPFGLIKQGNEPSRVVHARLTGNVQIADDKGTRDPLDDLHVAMDFVEYDEKTLRVTTESEVNLRDRDLRITGLGMTIQLRRKPAPATGPGAGAGGGFEAETVLLRKDPDVVINNVTPGGILPGQSRPDAKGRTPLHLTADGEMLLILPKPRAVVEVGPPDPFREPEPTLARFQRNVKVVRGVTNFDQLNSDTLDLTLMPDKKVEPDPAATGPATAAAPVASAATGGPLTELKLRKAVAKGHAVWIQSESQGMKARCLELTYDKHSEEGVPDKTYLNGGLSGKLWVEKVEYVASGDKAGAISSVRTVKAMDTTILDYGPGGTSRVIARGPGQMEERPARNASVERTVWWEEDMEMRTWRETPPASPPTKLAAATIPGQGPLRRLITLTGPSKLVDYKGGHTLDAQEKIVALFEALPKAAPATGDGAAAIKTLEAYKDVHLTTTGKVLTARDQFHAKFLQPEVMTVATRPAPPSGPAMPGPAPVAIASAGSDDPASPDSKPEAPPATPEPAVDGRANVIFATILQAVEGGKNEVQDAKLRGSVLVHQDAAAGEARGKDLSGEALDLTSRGNGLMNFVVFAEDPQAFEPRTRLAAAEGKDGAAKARLVAKGRPAGAGRLARIDLDGRTIEAPRIGLDQKINYAWAQGAGHIYQMAERGLLDDKGLASDRPKGAGKKPGGAGPGTKDRLVISWNDEMKAHGFSRDFDGRSVAKFEFRGTSQEVRTPNGGREFRRGVEAKMEDSAIYCDTMDVYMDKPIAFNKVSTKKPAPPPPGAEAAPAEPDPEIALLDCRGRNRVEDGQVAYAGVDISSRKMFPETGLLKEKQRIQHVHVVYDKRTGKFEAPGPGTVLLYQGEPAKLPDKKSLASIRPVSAIGRDGQGTIRMASRGAETDEAPTLKLTQVNFSEGMRGRFGVAKDQVETEPREAEFVGAVQAYNAVVAGPYSSIDFDNPPPDHINITSDVLRVRSYPPPLGSKAAARQFLFADGNGVARTVDRTIQGDRITFDSGNELAYVYGDDGKEVVLTEQKAISQNANSLRGKAGRFNKRTREFLILDPQAIQMFDLKTGVRPKPFSPDLGGSPKPPAIAPTPRTPLRREGRSSTERNGFTGH